MYLGLLFTAVTALLHLYFMYLEMFLWATPTGLRTFKMDLAKAKSSQVLAANQGVYNGLLAAGLIASFFMDAPCDIAVRSYCLVFILAVSLYGWYSVNFRIFLVQGLPALLALVFTIR